MNESQIGDKEFPSSDNSNHTSFGFVDADNLRKGLESALRRRSIPEGLWQHYELKSLIREAHLDRCYVFSAVEAGKDPESWLAKLRSSSGFVFKEALLKTSGKAKKQEGVDVLLAVEAMQSASRGNMTHCTIFSGDGDLLPLVSALVDQGIFTTVASFDNPEKGDVARRLCDVADDYVHIGSQILSGAVASEHQWTNRGGCKATQREYPKLCV